MTQAKSKEAEPAQERADAPAEGGGGGSHLIRPWDEHNRKLVENVHPPEWVNPEPKERYHMVVIGAGTAGLVTAAAAASLGARVALVEKHLMGGDCLNVGCVPSKGLIRASRACADVRDAGEFGVIVPDGVRVDFGKVMERMRRLRAQISRADSVKRFSEMGVDVFIGPGRFTGKDTLEVAGAALRFHRACIATGARAQAPPIPGLDDAGYLTNESIFSLTELPARLAVIGAGPIGCELSQAFQRFGSKVSLIEMGPQILLREDRDAAEILQRQIAADGVNLVLGAKLKEIQKRGDEKVLLVERDGKSEEITVDEILVGVGRAPNVNGLGLEEAGVEYDERKGVSVNDQLQTTNSNIYAAGDVCFLYKFTHTADFTARIVIQNALFQLPVLSAVVPALKPKKASDLVVPWCTYTDPEIAHVGMYEKDAEEKGIEVQTFRQDFADIDRAILDGEPEGFVKILTRKGTGEILGATIVARHAGEMIGELSVAIQGKVGLGAIAQAIHPYPTQAEAIRKAGDDYNRTRLTPRVKGFMDWWLARQL